MPTFAQIQDRINLDYLNRSDLVNETKRSILSAIRYYEKKRWWFNETATALTTSAGQTYVTFPTNFLILDDLQITLNSADYSLSRRNIDFIREANTTRTQGQPTDFAIYQNRIELFPIPGSAYSLPIHYIKSLTALSADTDTNAWLSVAEDCIVYRATMLMLLGAMGTPEKALPFAQLEAQSYKQLVSENEQRMNLRLHPTTF